MCDACYRILTSPQARTSVSPTKVQTSQVLFRKQTAREGSESSQAIAKSVSEGVASKSTPPPYKRNVSDGTLPDKNKPKTARVSKKKEPRAPTQVKPVQPTMVNAGFDHIQQQMRQIKEKPGKSKALQRVSMVCMSMCSLMMFGGWYWSIAVYVFSWLQNQMIGGLTAVGLGGAIAYMFLYKPERVEMYINTLKVTFSKEHWVSFGVEVVNDLKELLGSLWGDIKKKHAPSLEKQKSLRRQTSTKKTDKADGPVLRVLEEAKAAALKTALKRVWADCTEKHEWVTHTLQEDGVLIKTKKVKDRLIVKTYATMACSIEEAIPVLKDWTATANWDTSLSQTSVIESLEDNIEMVHMQTKNTMKLDARDFVMLRKWSEQASGCYVFGRVSVADDTAKPPSKGVVRAIAGVCGGVVFTPKIWDDLAILPTHKGTHCGVSFVMDYDLKVSMLPRQVVDRIIINWTATKTSGLIAKLKEMHEQTIPEVSSTAEDI